MSEAGACDLANSCQSLARLDEKADECLDLKEQQHLTSVTQSYRENMREYVTALAKSYNDLGQYYCMIENYEKAAINFKKAITKAPQSCEPHLNLALSMKGLFNFEECAFCYTRVLEMDPDNFMARYGLALGLLDKLYTGEEGWNLSLKQYSRALDELLSETEEEDKAKRRVHSDYVGRLYPSSLVYALEPLKELQQKNGQLFSKLMEAKYPEFTSEVKMPYLQKDEPLRLGLLGSHFQGSKPGSIYQNGLIQGLKQTNVEIYLYSTTLPPDDVVDSLKHTSFRFTSSSNLEEMAIKVKEDKLHGLYFSRIGQSSLVTRLALLRLAPIQMAGLCSLFTTGFKSIDYFLSGTNLEGDSSDSYYSEKLIRLSGLGACFDQSSLYRGQRKELGIEGVKILVCQPLDKHLADFDKALVEIALRAKEAKFLFIENPSSLALMAKKRLCKIFSHHGLDPNLRLAWFPNLLKNEFLDLAASCDMALDFWRGSSLEAGFEALSASCPFITLSSAFAHHNFGSALLKKMGLDRFIATSPHDYIEKATQLALSKSLRENYRKEIESGYKRFSYDKNPLIELERFLREEALVRAKI